MESILRPTYLQTTCRKAGSAQSSDKAENDLISMRKLNHDYELARTLRRRLLARKAKSIFNMESEYYHVKNQNISLAICAPIQDNHHAWAVCVNEQASPTKILIDVVGRLDKGQPGFAGRLIDE